MLGKREEMGEEGSKERMKDGSKKDRGMNE